MFVVELPHVRLSAQVNLTCGNVCSINDGLQMTVNEWKKVVENHIGWTSLRNEVLSALW